MDTPNKQLEDMKNKLIEVRTILGNNDALAKHLGFDTVNFNEYINTALKLQIILEKSSAIKMFRADDLIYLEEQIEAIRKSIELIKKNAHTTDFSKVSSRMLPKGTDVDGAFTTKRVVITSGTINAYKDTIEDISSSYKELEYINHRGYKL